MAGKLLAGRRMLAWCGDCARARPLLARHSHSNSGSLVQQSVAITLFPIVFRGVVSLVVSSGGGWHGFDEKQLTMSSQCLLSVLV